MNAPMGLEVTLIHELTIFKEWMDDPTVNEIAINDSNKEILIWRKGVWEKQEVPAMDLDRLCSIVANYTDNKLSESNPSISGELPDGSRIEISIPPACPHGSIYINLRKHKASSFTLNEFAEQGYFKDTQHCINLSLPSDTREKLRKHLTHTERTLLSYAEMGDWVGFLEQTQKLQGLNGLISGCMGTGKTTFLQALVDLVDINERIITVEDSNEIKITKHQNYQKLFFKRGNENNKTKMGATPTEALMTSLRKTPNRIYLGELRGAEALNFIEDVVNIGLNGSLTTLHASSSRLAFTRVASLIKRAESGKALSFDEIYDLIYPVVHFVVHIEFLAKENKRVCSEIYYDPIYSLYRQGLV